MGHGPEEYRIGDRVAIISNALRRAIDSTFITSIDRGSGGAAWLYRVHTCDGGVWFILRDRDCYETPIGAGVLLPSHQHPRYYQHFHIIPWREEHLEDIEHRHAAHQFRRDLSETYDAIYKLNSGQLKNLSTVLKAFLDKL